MTNIRLKALNVALSYCLEDNKDCSKNTPNKTDVIFIKSDYGEKVKKVKLFMTSIKKTYFNEKRKSMNRSRAHKILFIVFEMCKISITASSVFLHLL